MSRARTWGRAAAVAVAIALAGQAGAGCSTAKQKKLEARYGPSESVVEVVAVLRRHVPDDTYRFPPATDFTGRNVYRSSLLRLESIERMHADALRSGYMDGVLAFAKARALERLRGYDLAAVQYREAARIDDALREEALRSARVCDEIAAAVAVGIDFEDPVAPGDAGARDTEPADPDRIVAELDERVALLSFLLDEQEGTHYAAVIREEIERSDEARATWFERHRYDLPDGQLRAVSEMQRVVARHGSSKSRLRHILRLAALYDDLAHEYVNAVPPESLEFDPARFQDLVDPAVHLYESVAAQDGTPEKLEAARRLEAFLAFTLVVDRDRFTY
jgi:hypothetical protein